MSVMSRVRQAASLILATRNTVPSEHPLKTLIMKRSAKMGHFPNAYVFPGGNRDEADEHIDWLTVLPKAEQNVQLNIDGLVDTSSVPKAISSRITAIRETFEESGLLLCKRNGDQPNDKIIPFEIHNVTEWRQKVRDDANEFINLCRINECFPNLRALYLFSNWVTPTTLPKRFDTKFFIAVLLNEVAVDIDGIETESAEWKPVTEILDDNSIFLPPPQVYELSKLKHFDGVDSLLRSATNSNFKKCNPFIPVQVSTDDGFVIILPGDEKYEKLYETRINTIEANCDTDCYRDKTMHRLEFRRMPKAPLKVTLVIENIDRKFNTLMLPNTSTNSKL